MVPTCTWHRTCTCLQEGFSSESRFDWLVRLYFLSFNIMTLVIFEVAIAFLVEAFVYKVLSRQRHRICRKHKGPFKHCQCPEGKLFKHRNIPALKHTWVIQGGILLMLGNDRHQGDNLTTPYRTHKTWAYMVPFFLAIILNRASL